MGEGQEWVTWHAGSVLIIRVFQTSPTWPQLSPNLTGVGDQVGVKLGYDVWMQFIVMLFDPNSFLNFTSWIEITQ